MRIPSAENLANQPKSLCTVNCLTKMEFMKLIACRNALKKKRIAQNFLIMKLTIFFLVVACFHATANGFAQKVSLSEKNTSLEKVFRQIKKQTGYTFVSTKTLLQKAQPVTVNVRNASLKDALDLCFSGQPISYTIINRTVVIIDKKKELAPQNRDVPTV